MKDAKAEPKFVFEKDAEEQAPDAAATPSEPGIPPIVPVEIHERVVTHIHPEMMGTAARLIAAKGTFPAEDRPARFDISRHPDGKTIGGQRTNAIATGGQILQVHHNLPTGMSIGVKIPGFKSTHSGDHTFVISGGPGTRSVDPTAGELVAVTDTPSDVWHKTDLEGHVSEKGEKGAMVALDSPVIDELLRAGYVDPTTATAFSYSPEHFARVEKSAYLPHEHINAAISRLTAAYEKSGAVDLNTASPTFELIPPPGQTVEQALASGPANKVYSFGFTAKTGYATSVGPESQ